MKMLRYLSLGCLMLPPGALAAEPQSGYVDVIYVPAAESEVSNPVFLNRADGDGFALRGRFQVLPRLFVQGEAQGNTYAADTSDISGTSARIGVGTPLYTHKRVEFYGLAEGLSVDFVDRVTDLPVIQESGVGLHVGFAVTPNATLTLHGQVGALKLEDSDGNEFQAGLAVKFDERLGGLIEYRHSEVDSVVGLGTPERVNYAFSEIRVGVRFSFDLGARKPESTP